MNAFVKKHIHTYEKCLWLVLFKETFIDNLIQAWLEHVEPVGVVPPRHSAVAIACAKCRYLGSEQT